MRRSYHVSASTERLSTCWEGIDLQKLWGAVLRTDFLMRNAILTLGALVGALLSSCQQPCSPANCASGCCDSAGICQLGIAYGACGIGGAKCSVCTGPQRCEQGACFTPIATGGGGGIGTTGGGTGTGGGGGPTGGGAAAASIDVMPLGDAADPIIVSTGESLKLIGRANGVSSPAVTFSVLNLTATGSLLRTGPQTAEFVTNLTAAATTQIQVTADAMSSLVRTITLLHNGTRKLQIVPSEYIFLSPRPYPLAPNTRQSFTMVDFTPNSPRGVRSTDWFIWTNEALNAADKPVNGATVLRNPGPVRVYARDLDSKQWASADVIVETTTEASVEITPSVATVNSNGTVQFTAFVSNGAPVTWSVVGTGAGSINNSGTYTAPLTAGVYLIEALPSGGDDEHFGLATVIVQ